MYCNLFILNREVRTHSIKKQSVTHKNFNEKPIPPIVRANKQAIENNAIDFLEHTNFETDADNKKISIAHSSYIAPEITIGNYIYLTLKIRIHIYICVF